MRRARLAEPSCNRHLTERNYRRRYELHRLKVESMGSSIDNKPPKRHPHLNPVRTRKDRERKRHGKIKRENKLLLITSITLMDEYFEMKKKIDEKKGEIEKLKYKFKELKSLVYSYKDDKDKEIDILQKEQLKFKNELEDLNNGYEKIIEDASKQIEEFMTKNKFS